MRFILVILLISNSFTLFAQDDLLALVEKKENKKEYITNGFKSSRVINNHSMEFIGKGVMDVRILHRFGPVSDGFKELFGLDRANMRIGFDYGIGKNLTTGFGRSNVGKELDGFIKYRPILQSRGGKWPSPVSVVLVTGMIYSTVAFADPTIENYETSRMSFYNEIIIGRKFNEKFTLELQPTMVHRNLVLLATDDNDVFALGVGARYKLTKRMALVVDYDYIISGLDMSIHNNPLGFGIDIETGGHVFQLHFSNSLGMNEKEFITNTVNDWGKGEIRFGFNLSRVFTITHPKK